MRPAHCLVPLALWLAFLLAPAAAQQAQPDLAPGDYITERGWGQLTIAKDRFEIIAVGANGHTCSLDGKRAGAEGRTDDDDDVCRVQFTARADGIEAKAKTPDTCRNFCGMRAQFEGLYLKPAPGCLDDEREKTQKAFKAAYVAKDYPKARELMAGMLAACGRTRGMMEGAGARNDLAITLFHLGRKDECLATLQPLTKDAARSDAKLREDYPPSDFESWLPDVKAARKNLQLCRS